MENGLNIINILYTGSHKSFPMHYGLSGGGGEFLKRILVNLYCTKCNEINIFHEMYKQFHIQEHTKDF